MTAITLDTHDWINPSSVRRHFPTKCVPEEGRLFDHLISNASSVVGMSGPQRSRMWTPRRGRQQFDLLCHDKRPELGGKAFQRVLRLTAKQSSIASIA